MSDDIYNAPQSELTTATTLDGYGSLEKGIAGDYQFAIGDVLSEAWEKTGGTKGIFWLAMLVYLIILSVFGSLASVLPTVIGVADAESGVLFFVSWSLSQIIQMGISAPLGAGLLVLGLRRAVGVNMEVGFVTKYFSMFLPLLGLSIAMYLLIALGFALFILPGIYLAISFYFAVLLKVDKNIGVWESLEASRKAVTHRWFSFFFFFLVLLLLVMVGFLSIIGWIWTVPMCTIAVGIAYRNMFGCESTTAA